MFIFWPVVALLFVVIKSVTVRSAVAAYAMLILFAVIPVGMGLGTYERNFAWADGFSLWEDAAAKSQKYDRPYLHLAQLHDARGDYENALEMYAQANEKYSERKSDYQFVIFNNTANIFFKMGDFSKAIEIWSYAANNVKDNSIIRRNLAIANARKKEWVNAVDQLNLALGMSPRQADLYILKSEYLLELGEYGEAITSLELAIAHGYNEKAARSVEAIAFYHMKEYEKAEQIFKRSYSDAMTVEVMIWLLAINLQTDDVAGITSSRNEIVRIASEKDLTKGVNIIQEPGYHLSHNNRLISELKNILHGLEHNG
jgi:tetratricopeptide (TPR) repeat protein